MKSRNCVLWCIKNKLPYNLSFCTQIMVLFKSVNSTDFHSLPSLTKLTLKLYFYRVMCRGYDASAREITLAERDSTQK
jgi:hypothetical protein